MDIKYGLLVKPLYEVLKAAEKGTIMWTESAKAAFKQLKRSLMSAPALGLPDLTKPFELFWMLLWGYWHSTLGISKELWPTFQNSLTMLVKGGLDA